jgi:outer membrane protein assembly factor BamB
MPDVVANAPFCPWCGKSRAVELAARATPLGVPGAAAPAAGAVSPFAKLAAAAASGGDVANEAARAIAQARRASRAEQTKNFTTSPYDLQLAFDPQIGFLLIGAHAPEGEPPRLRAFDPVQKRVVWEALANTQGIADVEWENIAVHGRNVYVALGGRMLRVLDLVSGQPKWGGELSDKINYEHDRGVNRQMMIIDAVPPGQRGAVIVPTVDYGLSAFDRDTGRPLWRETRQHNLDGWWPIEQSGLVILDTRPREVMQPAQQAPLAKLDGRIERCAIEGRYGLWQVKDWGWRQREGVVLQDLLANHEVFFEPVNDIEDDVVCTLGPGRMYCATESGEKLFAAPHGMPVPVMPGFQVRALKMCGPTLFALLEKHHGTGIRRLLALDPQTLAVRFDLGELSTEPNDEWNHQMASNGEILALVSSPNGNDDNCEILGVHATGRVLWKTNVGEWRSHYFLGGMLVVTTDEDFRIIRPNDGQVIAQYGDAGDMYQMLRV